MVGRKDGQTDGWTDGQTDGPTDQQTNRLTDYRTDGLMDRQTDGQTDRQTVTCAVNKSQLFYEKRISPLGQKFGHITTTIRKKCK